MQAPTSEEVPMTPDTQARGYSATKDQLMKRLARVEGQVRGVAKMVDEDRYCIDVVTQLRAARAALARVENEMLKEHLGHCVEAAITGGDPEEQRRKMAELIQLLERTEK